MPRRLVWRLKPAKPLELREPSLIRLLEVLDDKGRAIAGARVKILVESLGGVAVEPGGLDPASLRMPNPVVPDEALRAAG